MLSNIETARKHDELPAPTPTRVSALPAGWKPDEHGAWWMHTHPDYRRIVRALRRKYNLPAWAWKLASIRHPDPRIAIPTPKAVLRWAALYARDARKLWPSDPSSKYPQTREQIEEVRRIWRAIRASDRRHDARCKAAGRWMP
jgi:hypothetical protein